MINWETIKSLYNDKPTLLQWLKKVEAALSGATLTSVSVNIISVGVITLTFNFDDGTIITTPEIDLPQGAQGVSITDAAIVAGKLILTLSNGTVIDAGNTGAVLGFEIDSNQHLIVKYQNGTSEDLGAIFTGNVSITGNLSVGGNLSPLENICDSQGRKRFLEGTLSQPEISGLTRTYNRWSLSGTHLMIVLAGTLAANTSLSFGTSLGAAVVPQWLADKVVPLISNKALVVQQTFIRPNGGVERANVAIAKYLNSLIVETYGNITFNDDMTFRIQFDLLIDAQ